MIIRYAKEKWLGQTSVQQKAIIYLKKVTHKLDGNCYFHGIDFQESMSKMINLKYITKMSTKETLKL